MRAQLGSVIADHNQPKDVYKIDESIFYQCYKSSVDGGWGYDSIVNGRLNLNCNIIIGKANASAITIAHSVRESLECTGSLFVCGRDQTTKRTICQIGCGDETDEKTAFNGSSSTFQGLDANCIIKKMVGTQFGTLNILAGIINNDVFHFDGGAVVRSSVNGQLNIISADMAGTRNTTWRDLVNTQQGFNPSSSRVTWGAISITDTEYGFYFVYGFVEPEIWYAKIQRTDYDAFAFVDALRKTFVNSEVNVFNMTGFWAIPVYISKKTIDITCHTESGIPIDNVSVKIWDSTGALVVNEISDSVGVIAQQKVQVASFDMTDYSSIVNNPFKVVVTKAGWAEILFYETISEPLTYIFVLKNKNPETVGSGQ